VFRVEQLALGQRLAPMVTDTSILIDKAIKEGKKVLCEGAQGALLDVDHGTYPFVTSSNTAAGAVCTGGGFGPTRVTGAVGISKAYTTRVGAGPFPTEDLGDVGNRLREVGQEFGATTGRPRRCGWFDAVVVRASVRVSGLTSIALSKLDILSGLDTVKVCVGYELNGERFDRIPARLDQLAEVVPVYEELPGWSEDISKMEGFDEMPEGAKAYVKRIEELVGVPVSVVGVGPGRKQTILRSDPFGG